MFVWYVRNAPIKRKLMLAFGLVGAVAGAATGVIGWHLSGLAAATSDPELRQAALGARDATVVALVLELTAIAALALLFTRCIGNPYVTTVLRMEALARGDLDSPVRFTDYRDCVGRITRAMQTFRDAARERDELHRAASGHQAELDGRLRATETAFERRGQDQRTVLEALAKALSTLKDGDLGARMEGDVPSDYRALREDFDGAVAALQQTLVSVAAHVGSMGTGASEIAGAADDLSRRTERQAASLEETAAAIDEVSATVRQTADGAGRARGVVAEARTAADRSSAVMDEAIAAMTRIQTSSNEIGQIISVVDEIAFQTNLLALNAGVEAARAGDAGRGFAVVASEVRALAQRSAEAAREIKALISTSSTEVTAGVGLVTRTGELLQRIAAQVGDIDGLVGEIAASAQEQAGALAEVNVAVNQMDQVTQQNAAMVEQSTAASHRLAAEAAELAILVGAFRGLGTRDDDDASRLAPPVRLVRAETEQRGSQASGPSRARAVLSAIGGGGAVRRLEAAVAGDRRNR